MVKKGVTFVLFGGTGDLTRRKLVPAFADLVHRGVIGKNSTIIGISRKEMSDGDYKKFLVGSEKDMREKGHIKKLKIKYMKGDFSGRGGLTGLKEIINSCEKGGCDRIFYLATSYKYFPNIVKELKRNGLSKQRSGFLRVVFEKPFGKDLRSSEKLDKGINKVFREEDIYRIDHYLAKGTVQNLNVLKFTNPILYNTFGNKNVESVEITVDEKLGVGNRIEYYNGAGALKDMVQNHLLQVLSLVLMERPKSLKPDDIHDKKVDVLKNIEVMPSRNHLLGQYKEYEKELKEAGMKKSKTETFARVELNCKMKRWDGVKLLLRTGKKMNRKHGEIKIKFKPAAEKFMVGFTGFKNNEIIIGIYPRLDVTVWMNSKTRERNNEVRPVKFEFCEECEFGPNTTDEYATLLEEAIKGDKTLFTRDDEVKESWKIVDKIENMRGRVKFKLYKDGWDGN